MPATASEHNARRAMLCAVLRAGHACRAQVEAVCQWLLQCAPVPLELPALQTSRGACNMSACVTCLQINMASIVTATQPPQTLQQQSPPPQPPCPSQQCKVLQFQARHLQPHYARRVQSRRCSGAMPRANQPPALQRRQPQEPPFSQLRF